MSFIVWLIFIYFYQDHLDFYTQTSCCFKKKTFSEILMWCLELGRFTCKFLSVELISNAFLARHRELNLHLVDFICYVRKFSAAGNLLNEKMTYKKNNERNVSSISSMKIWRQECKYAVQNVKQENGIKYDIFGVKHWLYTFSGMEHL